MYETLFRGKPKSNDEYYCFSQIWKDNCKNGFVYGLLIVKQDRYFICVSTTGLKMNCCINNSTVSIIEVIPETVGQYIGRKNKYGKKIFVGDIVRHHLGDDIGIVKLGEYKQPFDDIHTKHIGFFVDWISGSSKNTLRKDVGYWANLDNNSIYEIFIGENIHDNPELVGNFEQLKEGKQK